jgi:hypothetical protein
MTAVQLNGRYHICTRHVDTSLRTCSSSRVGVLGDVLEKPATKAHILYICYSLTLLISYIPPPQISLHFPQNTSFYFNQNIAALSDHSWLSNIDNKILFLWLLFSYQTYTALIIWNDEDTKLTLWKETSLLEHWKFFLIIPLTIQHTKLISHFMYVCLAWVQYAVWKVLLWNRKI